MLKFENAIPLKSAEEMRGITRSADLFNSSQFRKLADAIAQEAEKGSYAVRVTITGKRFTEEQLELLEEVLTDAGYQHQILNGETEREYDVWIHWHEDDGLPF